MGLCRCTVSFTDLDGIAHEVSIHADSLYEAVGMAVAEFRSDGLAEAAPGALTEFTISVHRPALTHKLKLKQVMNWVDGGGKSPHDTLRRARVKQLLVPKVPGS